MSYIVHQKTCGLSAKALQSPACTTKQNRYIDIFKTYLATKQVECNGVRIINTLQFLKVQ